MKAIFGSAAVVVLVVLAAGCGGQQRAALVVATEDRLQQARQTGAENDAPYEFYSARAHLDEVTQHAGNRHADAAFTSADEAVTLPR